MGHRDGIDVPDPRAQAQRTLTAIMAVNAARSGAVFTLGPGGLALVVSAGIDQRGLDAATLAWMRDRHLLREGETVSAGEFSVTPLIDGAFKTVGLLCLDRLDEKLCPPGDLRVLTGSLARQVVRATMGETIGPIEDLAEGEAKHRLLGLLNRHEWNIARVARAYGVTRMTIYAWLGRYGIQRQRLRKS